MHDAQLEEETILFFTHFFPHVFVTVVPLFGSWRLQTTKKTNRKTANNDSEADRNIWHTGDIRSRKYMVLSAFESCSHANEQSIC